MASLQQHGAEAVAGYWDDFYVYTPGRFVAIGTGATLTQNINIQSDSDFCLQKLTFQSDVSAAAVTVSSMNQPNVNILITDSGSGRQLMNNVLPISLIFGTGQIPFILPKPKWFAANSNIVVALTSFEASNTPNIQLAFIGFKRYPMAAGTPMFSSR